VLSNSLVGHSMTYNVPKILKLIRRLKYICVPNYYSNYASSFSNYVSVFKFPSNEETKPIWKEILKIEE
jgi:hypothetical protein